MQSYDLRKISFYFALALTFIRCSQIHELIGYQLHLNSYLLFICGIPAILGLIHSHSLGRPFRYKQTWLWFGFSLWLILTIPFSTWKGGAAEVVRDYWRTNVILVVLLGGLTTTWKEFERLIYLLAASCVVNLVIIKIYGQVDMNGRMVLPFGLVANSNDYAAHLLLLLPAVLWIALVAKSATIRVAVLGVCGYGLFAVLSSGSRGALIAIAAGIFYFLLTASTNQRRWALGLASIMMVTSISLLSQQVKQRIFSFSASDDRSSEEALESSGLRAQVLKDAIGYALANPLFGLGPANFSTFEGKGKPRIWEPAHNSYVQIACECGFPAFFLFVGGIVFSFLTFWRIKLRFRGNRTARRLTQAAVCMQLMMVMFCLSVGFLNFAYAYHFPLMVGISVAMGYATNHWSRWHGRNAGAPQQSSHGTGVN
jgi:putative inorganic carbon (hco3(-)) transporter